MKYMKWILLFIVFIIFVQIITVVYDQSQVTSPLISNAIANDIMYIPANGIMTQGSSILDDKTYKDAFYANIGHFMTKKGTDGEMIDAAEHFFWGLTRGTVLELGAYDGQLHSQSLFFEKIFDWTRILIEGNPQLGRMLQSLNPSAISVNAAVCSENRTLHWAGGNNGIVEFLPMKLLAGVMNGALYESVAKSHCVSPNGTVDWNRFDFRQFPGVVEISCLPLHKILRAANVTHVNFFVLDVEGGEFSVLQTIDWNAVKFDVIAVETEVGSDGTSITQYLEKQSYVVAAKIGRNTWYQHVEYVPRAREIRRRDLYMGHLLSQQNIRQFPPRFIVGNGLPEDPILNLSCHVICKSLAKTWKGKGYARSGDIG